MSKDIIYEKSGGRRIPLYAEIGRYFTPRGILNESEFRQSLRRSLMEIQNEKKNKRKKNINAGNWLSTYLNEIISYLEEKNLSDASYNIITIALEESSDCGITNISMPVVFLEKIIKKYPLKNKMLSKKAAKEDDKRQKIFQSSIKVFAEEGFHRSTIDKIAKRAGIAKGSVYLYFKSKEDLLNELLNEKFEVIINQISQIYSEEHDLLKQVEDMIESWISFISENHTLYKIIQSETIFNPSGKRIIFYDYIISNLPLFKERVVSLNKNNRLKTTSFYTVFYGIMGFIDGVVQKWFRCGMDYPLSDEIPIILEVLFNGFVGENVTRKRFFIPPEDFKP